MEQKGSKYDTDPLDPDFARRTDEIFGATEHINRPPDAEAQPPRQSAPAFEPAHDFFAEQPTRRFDEAPSSASYPSVFVPPPPAAAPQQQHQPPPAARGFADYAPPAAYPAAPGQNRRVAKLGVPENIASGMAYAPFFIGLIVSLIELLLLPRGETRTRFHAAQALSIHLAILAAGVVFKLARFVVDIAAGGFSSGMLSLISGIFSLSAMIFLIVATVRVCKGEDLRYPSVADVTKWINQHLDPIK